MQLEDQVGPIENQEDCVLYGFNDTAKQLEQLSWDDCDLNNEDELNNQEMRNRLARLRGYNDKEDELSKKEDKIAFDFECFLWLSVWCL